MKRLMYLKARFERNPSYFADYMKFMDDLIKKGYARKEDTRPPGKTWFIPHHGVYHPSKPGKTGLKIISRHWQKLVETPEHPLSPEIADKYQFKIGKKSCGKHLCTKKLCYIF